MSESAPHYTLIFDTETTGLPPRKVSPSQVHAWDGCRIVQIAWEMYDDAGNHVSSECYLVRPDNFQIPAEATRIHGITQEHAVAHGIPIQQVWARLLGILPRVQCLVAHNISFDDAVVQSELYRTKQVDPSTDALLSLWEAPQKICTMKTACTHPGQKWPKLIELYRAYFGKLPDEKLHRADADVRACAAVFFHQKQQNLKMLS